MDAKTTEARSKESRRDGIFLEADGVTETVRSLSEQKERGGERKKTGRDQTELRLHKKAPRASSLSDLSTRAHGDLPYVAQRSRNRADLPREAPPNGGSYTRGRIVASPPIGRHVARHCFIHACCTFLVYLVQVAPGPGFEPALLRPGPDHRFFARLYKWQHDRR